MDKEALDILKEYKIMTLVDLKKCSSNELKRIFNIKSNAEYYEGSFSSWKKQAGNKELQRNTSKKWVLKDLF